MTSEDCLDVPWVRESWRPLLTDLTPMQKKHRPILLMNRTLRTCELFTSAPVCGDMSSGVPREQQDKSSGRLCPGVSYVSTFTSCHCCLLRDIELALCLRHVHQVWEGQQSSRFPRGVSGCSPQAGLRLLTPSHLFPLQPQGASNSDLSSLCPSLLSLTCVALARTLALPNLGFGPSRLTV